MHSEVRRVRFRGFRKRKIVRSGAQISKFPSRGAQRLDRVCRGLASWPDRRMVSGGRAAVGNLQVFVSMTDIATARGLEQAVELAVLRSMAAIARVENDVSSLVLFVRGFQDTEGARGEVAVGLTTGPQCVVSAVILLNLFEFRLRFPRLRVAGTIVRRRAWVLLVPH